MITWYAYKGEFKKLWKAIKLRFGFWFFYLVAILFAFYSCLSECTMRVCVVCHVCEREILFVFVFCFSFFTFFASIFFLTREVFHQLMYYWPSMPHCLEFFFILQTFKTNYWSLRPYYIVIVTCVAWSTMLVLYIIYFA